MSHPVRGLYKQDCFHFNDKLETLPHKRYSIERFVKDSDSYFCDAGLWHLFWTLLTLSRGSLHLINWREFKIGAAHSLILWKLLCRERSALVFFSRVEFSQNYCWKRWSGFHQFKFNQRNQPFSFSIFSTPFVIFLSLSQEAFCNFFVFNFCWEPSRFETFLFRYELVCVCNVWSLMCVAYHGRHWDISCNHSNKFLTFPSNFGPQIEV